MASGLEGLVGFTRVAIAWIRRCFRFCCGDIRHSGFWSSSLRLWGILLSAILGGIQSLCIECLSVREGLVEWRWLVLRAPMWELWRLMRIWLSASYWSWVSIKLKGTQEEVELYLPGHLMSFDMRGSRPFCIMLDPSSFLSNARCGEASHKTNSKISFNLSFLVYRWISSAEDKYSTSVFGHDWSVGSV